MTNILEKIMATKRQEVAAAKAALPEGELRARLADAPPVRDFFAALAADGPIKLIAEVKKA
ncbi:MAG TPA: indole-3-glycerol-phosphate synthase TrpC, partial [Pirellulaceae bacterium]|nr:indole-3-glycerol-phosphate synthase TrpC [Pirellulaceae bacterium]